LWLLSYLLGVLCFRHASREIAYAAAIGAVGVIAALPGLNTLFDGGRPIGEEYLTFLKDRWPYITAAVVAFILGAVDFRRFRLSAEWQPRLAGFVMALSVGLGAVFVLTWEDRRRDDILSATRNFYGTLKVINYNADDEDDNYHLLLHGATTHGLQFVRADKAVMPTTYYADASGVGLAINNLPQSPRRLGLVGLGTGTLAAYARAGDYLRIYEINPDVEQLARKHFKYLDYCQGKVDIVMGDARLMMDREVAAGNTQKFDLLALDAFSSDAIPVHLLTREAFQTYLRQIRDDGVIAVHISNRYLDLRPVVERLAAEFGLSTVCISEDSEANWWVYATTWVLVSRDKTFLAAKDIAAAADTAASTKAGPLWTDDFASLYAILK
ncbi:MAG: spermidine synthase, partial [Opitutaceae bacterium]